MDNWEVGDLALCINDQPIFCEELNDYHTGKWAPKVGSISEVTEVGDAEKLYPGYAVCKCPNLKLASGGIGHFTRFVKVTPEEDDEFDREIIELYKMEPEGVPPNLCTTLN